MAAAAKSLQSCSTLCDPIDGSPPGSPFPGSLQASTLEWVAISFSNAWKWKVKVKLLSHVWLFETPWTAAYQPPPSKGFSRQEYWSGCHRLLGFRWLLLLKKKKILVNSKRNQSWILIGRSDAEADTPILWPPDAKNWLTGKDPDAGKYWTGEEKGTTEDERVGWHHWLDAHEFEQVPGVGDGQGSLVCCSPWGRKELDTTDWLNLTE